MEQGKKINKDKIYNFLSKYFKPNIPKLDNLLKETLKPIPDVSITDWCEQNLVLPPEMSSESGAYRLDRTPYLIDIVNCLHPTSPYKEIVFYAGTQLGKTQALICAISYLISNSPANMLFGFSNNDQLKNFVQSRLNPFIDANPNLKSKFITSRKNEKAETVRKKTFAGGSLYFASAEAPASFRSNPCRYVFADEIDSYPLDAKGEGSPIDLARRRTSSFNDIGYKIYLCSTTTNKASQIKAEYEKTDMRELYFECPECGELQTLEFSRFSWIVDGLSVKDVWYECPHCKAKIRNEQKEDLFKTARWMPTNTVETDPQKIGFHLSGLWAPIGWQDWKSCITTYLEAQRENSEEKMTSFYNTILAEPYETSSDVPKWERLLDRANHSDYSRGEIPNEVIFLTSFTDVQQERLETTLIGWGKHLRPYVIDHLILLCHQGSNTSDPNNAVWDDWDNLFYNNIFTRKDGVRVNLIASGIDRSYNTSSVSQFVDRHNDYSKIIACRGSDYLQSPISSLKKDTPANNRTQASKSQHKTRTDGVYYYIETGVSILKANLYKALKEDDNPDHSKYMFASFGQGMDEEYFRQLTAEHYVAPNTKHPRGWWYKDRNRNEALDTFVGNIAMLYYTKANSMTDSEWDELENSLNAQKIRPMNINEKKVFSQKTKRRILNRGIEI